MKALRSPAVLESLHGIQGHVVGQAEQLGLPPDMALKLELVLEELAVNVISYAYPDGQGDIEVECREEQSGQDRTFCVVLRDWGKAFNPLKRDTPDTEAEMDDRPIGGLGIHLALQMADAIHYDRRGDANELTVCFRISA